DTLHFGEVADLRLERGDELDRADPRGGRALFDGEIGADLAGDKFPIRTLGDLPREQHEVSAAHGRHVVRDGRRGCRQLDAELGEPGFRRGGRRGTDEGTEQQEGGKMAEVHASLKTTRRPLATPDTSNFTS